jgi:hypothetical protein
MGSRARMAKVATGVVGRPLAWSQGPVVGVGRAPASRPEHRRRWHNLGPSGDVAAPLGQLKPARVERRMGGRSQHAIPGGVTNPGFELQEEGCPRSRVAVPLLEPARRHVQVSGSPRTRQGCPRSAGRQRRL